MIVSLGNLIPCPTELGTAVCVVCRSEMPLNARGNYLVGLLTPEFCCDDCGGRLRPDLTRLLHRLRHSVNFTPTIGGSASRVCAMCAERVESDAVIGWHVVAIRDGAPICDSCTLDQDPQIVGLCHILRELSRAEALARLEFR